LDIKLIRAGSDGLNDGFRLAGPFAFKLPDIRIRWMVLPALAKPLVSVGKELREV
jgi:hypothetical protein